MKKNWMKYSIAMALALGMLLSTMVFAEEKDGIDLYSPEIFDGKLADEPMAVNIFMGEEPMSAEAPADAEMPISVDTPMGAEPIPEIVPQFVAAPEFVPMDATQAVALTGKKASVQMNIGETLQIVVNEGETGSFTSKKTNLATVDASGLVTALAKGKIGIEFKPDGGKKRTLNITIVDPYEPKGISIAQGKTVGINVGQSLQLGAVLDPETAQTILTWSSSKAAVAPVDENGIVTGIKEGKAKITVMTANKKKAKITVVVSDPYKPSGVAIAQGGEITLNAGESVQLVAGLIPEGAISTLTWSGGKAKVATVDANGVVTAVGKGKVTITVTTGNGKKAKCKVTVNAPEAPKAPKKVTLNAKKATLNVGEGYQLVATLPANSVSDLTWSTSNAAVAVVDANGYVTVVSPGTATITVVTVNGKKASFAVTVSDPYKPSGVSIAQGGTITLNTGESVQLNAVLSPENAISTLTWTSSKAKVATVDANGLVNAVGKGTATVTVKTANGKKAKCKVTVKENVEPSKPSEDWSSLYKQFVLNQGYLDPALALYFPFDDDEDGEKDAEFSLYDLDKNDIPELVVFNCGLTNRGEYYVFTCRNGEVVYLGGVGHGGDSGEGLYYFKDTAIPGLFCLAYWDLSYYYIVNGELRRERIGYWDEDEGEQYPFIAYTDNKALIDLFGDNWYIKGKYYAIEQMRKDKFINSLN